MNRSLARLAALLALLIPITLTAPRAIAQKAGGKAKRAAAKPAPKAPAPKAALITYSYEVLVPPTIQRIPPSSMKTQIVNRIKKMKRTYTLYAREGLSAFTTGYKGGSQLRATGPLASVRDAERGEHLQMEELLGKTYLVRETDTPHQWFYGDGEESKTILGKKCLRATLADAPNKVVAWYTEEIPEYKTGPLGFNGLPGLILEIEYVDEMVCRATRINLRANGRIQVTPPTAGATRTRDEYNALRAQIYAEKKFKEETRIPIEL